MTTAIDPKAVRRTILELAYRTGIGHLPSCYSVVEMLVVLYSKIMRHDPHNPKWPDRDYFILSKGHAAGAIFSVLAHAGYFAPEDLIETYGRRHGRFGCHPDRNKVPGIEASTGSLGHGMPFAVGIAMGLKIRKRPNRVFCLVGDGESNEGSIWEASMVAAHRKLDNVFCVLDLNESQSRCLPLTRAAEKWVSFGWNVGEADGHSLADLEAGFTKLYETRNGRPSLLVAHTIKGKGASLCEQDFFTWHHKAPNEQEYQLMRKELE